MAQQYATSAFIDGWTAAEDSGLEAGIAALRRGFASRAASGRNFEEPQVLAYLVEMLVEAAQPEEGMKVLAEAFAGSGDKGMIYWDAELHRLRGVLLLLSDGNESEAEACFKQAIEIARGQSARSFELRAAIGLARLWQGEGKRSEARDILAPVYDWFTEGFDTTDLKAAKVLLDELT